jgi:hypothetical protein
MLRIARARSWAIMNMRLRRLDDETVAAALLAANRLGDIRTSTFALSLPRNGKDSCLRLADVCFGTSADQIGIMRLRPLRVKS